LALRHRSQQLGVRASRGVTCIFAKLPARCALRITIHKNAYSFCNLVPAIGSWQKMKIVRQKMENLKGKSKGDLGRVGAGGNWQATKEQRANRSDDARHFRAQYTP
jgi:hypothetical protein